MTAYLSRTALDQPDAAQAELERHLVTGSDGRCSGCRQTEPCAARAQAQEVFARYGRLPERRPGVTRAGLRRVATGAEQAGWFAG